MAGQILCVHVERKPARGGSHFTNLHARRFSLQKLRRALHRGQKLLWLRCNRQVVTMLLQYRLHQKVASNARLPVGIAPRVGHDAGLPLQADRNIFARARLQSVLASHTAVGRTKLRVNCFGTLSRFGRSKHKFTRTRLRHRFRREARLRLPRRNILRLNLRCALASVLAAERLLVDRVRRAARRARYIRRCRQYKFTLGNAFSVISCPKAGMICEKP